eukprot:g3410.t1
MNRMSGEKSARKVLLDTQRKIVGDFAEMRGELKSYCAESKYRGGFNELLSHIDPKQIEQIGRTFSPKTDEAQEQKDVWDRQLSTADVWANKEMNENNTQRSDSELNLFPSQREKFNIEMEKYMENEDAFSKLSLTTQRLLQTNVEGLFKTLKHRARRNRNVRLYQNKIGVDKRKKSLGIAEHWQNRLADIKMKNKKMLIEENIIKNEENKSLEEKELSISDFEISPEKIVSENLFKGREIEQSTAQAIRRAAFAAQKQTYSMPLRYKELLNRAEQLAIKSLKDIQQYTEIEEAVEPPLYKSSEEEEEVENESLPSHQKFDRVFTKIDPNDDDKVTLERFTESHNRDHPKKPKDLHAQLLHLFNVIDSKRLENDFDDSLKKGCFRKQDVADLLKLAGYQMTGKYKLKTIKSIDDAFQEMDKTGTGSVSHEEFVLWYCSHHNMKITRVH